MIRRFHEDNGFDCPHCGDYVAGSASRCRTCGADDDCGWAPEEFGAVDDDDFDYDDYVAREFPGHADRHSAAGQRRLLVFWIVIILVLALLVSQV
ncbi:MAG: hypothetical protein KDA89_21185 [Planctomycetaceae bacterium]|nr:hypothetical protein [Planctomycetaceae bacterium]